MSPEDMPPSADLHTPDELLQVAQKLLSSGDPDVRRAVVLESITALEAFVQRTVFRLLEANMDPLLVHWLEDRTRMDFDSRLGVITPVAVGKPIDKSSRLWSDYTRAKNIRNRITHSGKRVSSEEARFVLDTVTAWLAYLGSTADVANALQEMKAWIESKRVPIPDERTAVTLVEEFFAHTKAFGRREVTSAQGKRADLVLSFGPETVVVEVKLITRSASSLERWIQAAVAQASEYSAHIGTTRVAVVLFVREAVPEAYQAVRIVRESTASVVVISAETER